MLGCKQNFRLLGAALVAALCLGCTPRVLDVVDKAPDPILRGLVGWWPLDDGAGSGSAQDVSGNDNQGTLIDFGAATPWVPGKAGTALELGGFGYVLVPHPSSASSIDSIVTEVTMSVWIYFEGSVSAADAWGTALSREIGNTNRQHYHIALSVSEMPSMYINDSLTTGNTAAQRFKWTHLAGTYDGANARLYVNGVLAQPPQPVTGPFTADTTPLILGGNGNGPTLGVTERFPGAVDELMLWNRALGAEEIARLAAGPLPR